MKSHDDYLTNEFLLQSKQKKTRLDFKCNLKLCEYDVVKADKSAAQKTRAEYKTTHKKKFLCFLYETQHDTLVAAGIPEHELLLMLEGHTPKGFSIHHKIPISLGGSNNVENLCLLFHEQHVLIHQMINWQLSGMKSRILLPKPHGNIDLNVDITVESRVVPPRLSPLIPKLTFQ